MHFYSSRIAGYLYTRFEDAEWNNGHCAGPEYQCRSVQCRLWELYEPLGRRRARPTAGLGASVHQRHSNSSSSPCPISPRLFDLRLFIYPVDPRSNYKSPFDSLRARPCFIPFATSNLRVRIVSKPLVAINPPYHLFSVHATIY